MHRASVPWNEKVDQIQYNGDAINLFPEKMSFSCTLGYVREMRGMILTVRYKADDDACSASDLSHEERLLVTLAHVCSDVWKKLTALLIAEDGLLRPYTQLIQSSL